ncbi:hypothetical protein F5B22DRAFT_466099 [Xylaria bambusicola]|uniref:uncharacterized protein n=1 Tax=Xylaria bambusicola TaxID=326684 RepID=UPI002007338F|nr:uncharacterized protein F5B22DRAFT_466099 [Xylaria bambusicola]KAI0522229.1 hypothetical protein F5B22DRAFT_466099 [Xylaria bambusicola]
MHPQRESRLLSAPVEIRRAIYAMIIPREIHAFLSRGRLRLSVCLEPNLGDDSHDGRERRSGTDHEGISKWARRLRSSWGPHWECEETSHARYQSNIHGFLFLCKQVFFEVSDIMTEIAAINVTDLETLSILLGRDQSKDVFNYSWILWEHICFTNIRKLNLTFRLPVASYRELEDEDTVPRQMSTESTVRALWASSWPDLLISRELRSLHIWLDHDNSSSWSTVKERMVLRTLSAALTAHKQAPSQTETPQAPDVVVSLPKLHPGMAAPGSHFTQDSLSLPFTIQRRYRQRWHCKETSNGDLDIQYRPDFPIMEELRHLEPDREWTLQGIEELEITLLESGEDVEAVFGELLNSPSICY